MNSKTTAKDFFLHVAVIVLLYSGTIALLNILFNVINEAFPQVANNSFYSSATISFPVATLIVVFPLLLFLASRLRKEYEADPNKKDYAVRKWLIYITLFIAGGVLAGDLITLIFFFLDGQEITTAFILKVLSVLIVIGSIFGYYLDDLKDRLTSSRRMLWRVVALVLVLGSIALGFSVLGTPQSQRELRNDNERISDLQSIQWQVVNYWQQKGAIPNRLDELEDSISGFRIPVDPETGELYGYEKTGRLSFELCANFKRESRDNNLNNIEPRRVPVSSVKFGFEENWQHGEGEECFSREIDPELYPVNR